MVCLEQRYIYWENRFTYSSFLPTIYIMQTWKSLLMNKEETPYTMPKYHNFLAVLTKFDIFYFNYMYLLKNPRGSREPVIAHLVKLGRVNL
jgi:hypothetical protein